jgi:nitroreductase
VVLVGAARGEFDLGRAAQSMMLAADRMGIGSCPATLHDEDTVRRLLNIPADRPARYAIAFGHPDSDLEPIVRENLRAITGRARKPLEDVVRWERFS